MEVIVGDRIRMNRGRMGEVKTLRSESKSKEKETEQEVSATWTTEDRIKDCRA